MVTCHCTQNDLQFTVSISVSIHFFSPLQLGYDLEDEQLDSIFWRFKAVAEQKKVNSNPQMSNFFFMHYIYVATWITY